MKYIKRNQIEKNTLQNGRVFFYAQDRSRTYKPLRALAPEASVFAISPPGRPLKYTARTRPCQEVWGERLTEVDMQTSSQDK